MADFEFNAGASLGRIRLGAELDSATELAVLEEINTLTSEIFNQVSTPAFSKQLARFNAAHVGQEIELSWLVATYIDFLSAVVKQTAAAPSWPALDVSEILVAEIRLEKINDLEINKPELAKHFCWWILHSYLQLTFPRKSFVIGDGNLHYSLGNWELLIVNPLSENEIYIQAAGTCFVQLLQHGRNLQSRILLARSLNALALAQLEKLIAAIPSLPLQSIYDYCQQQQIELWELDSNDQIIDLLMTS